MKKSLSVMSVLLVLLTGFIFTGCQELAGEISAPKDVWCETYVDYAGVTLGVAAIYVDEETTGLGGSRQMSDDVTLKPGITFVVWSEDGDNQIISALTSNVYMLKTFGKDGTDVDDDPEDTTAKFSLKGTALNWTAIYLARADFRKSENQTDLPKAPDILLTKTGATPIFDADGFSWKKLLKSFILKQALSKLEG